MEEYLNRLKTIHYTWFALAALWFVTFIAMSVYINQPPAPVFDYGVPPGHGPEIFAAIAAIAYIALGFMLCKRHSRYAANFAKASYDRGSVPDGSVFRVTPAKRHLPFWLFGIFGGVFAVSVPEMLAGHGFGTFLTVACGGTFALLGLQPKLWLPLTNQAFEITPSEIRHEGKITAMKDIKAIFIGNFIPDKKDDSQPRMYYRPQQPMIVTGGGAAAAAPVYAPAQGSLIALVNRYAHEMRARSFQIEVVTDGINLILARGLDFATAQALMGEIEKAARSDNTAAA